MVSRKTADAISKSHDLRSQSADLKTLTEHLIAETLETIKASRAIIDRDRLHPAQS